LTCRESQVEGTKSKGKGRRTWNDSVKVDIKSPILIKDDAHNRDEWRSLTTGSRPTLPECGDEEGILYGLSFCDDKR